MFEDFERVTSDIVGVVGNILMIVLGVAVIGLILLAIIAGVFAIASSIIHP